MKMYKDSYSEAVFEFCNFLSISYFFPDRNYVDSSTRFIGAYKRKEENGV